MSRSHLCHQFREHFGTTISNYVVRRRMSITRRRLIDINPRPGEITKEVGYPYIYQFSKQFKRRSASAEPNTASNTHMSPMSNAGSP